MKHLLIFLFLAVSALAQTAPVLVKSAYCPSATPCQVGEPDGYASANSVRIALQTDLIIKRVYVKCGTSSGNYAYTHEHHPNFTITQAMNNRGHMILFGGLKPSTTYYCVAGASVNSDGTGGSVESSEFTVTTPAKPSTVWDRPADPALPDTLTTPTATVTYNVAADCSDLQTQWDAMATAHGAGGGAENVNREIVIPAGAVCGQLIERNHTTGTGWVIVRSSAVGTNNFPPAGVRLDPARYQAQMARIQTAYKSVVTGNTMTHAAARANDAESRVWHAGIIFEATPTVDNVVAKQQTATCTPNAGGVIVSSTGAHYFGNGSRVKILTNSTITGLAGNWYSVEGVTGSSANFVLTGTGALTGTAGSCTYGVLGDMKLAGCAANPGTGEIQCNTVDADDNPVQHGLVTGQVVKVLSPDPVFTEDFVNYSGTFGFGGRTNTSTPAWTDKVTVVNGDTLRFDGRIPNGTYEGNARLLYDGANVPHGYWVDDPPKSVNHVIFDRCWFHSHGLLYREYAHLRYACTTDCLLRDSVVDPNLQWVLTYDTNYDIRTITNTTNGTNVNIDWMRTKSALINNKIGYTVIGVSGSSNNSGFPIVSGITVQRNTFYYPCEVRGWADQNPCGSGLTALYNRQPLEWKSAEYSKVDGNRFYAMPGGQDRGAAVVFSSRPYGEGLDYPDSLYNRHYGHTFTNNTVLSHGVGIENIGSNTSDGWNDTPAQQGPYIANNIFVTDSLRYRIGGGFGDGFGYCIELVNGVENAVIDHNLCLQRGKSGNALRAGAPKSAGLRITNNIFTEHSGSTSYSTLLADANSYEVTPIAGNLAWGTTSWQKWTRGMLNLGSSVDVVGGTSAGTYADFDPDLVFKNNAFVTGVRAYNSVMPYSYDTDNSANYNTTKTQCAADLGGFIDSNNFPNNICFDAGNSSGSGADTWLKREAAAKFLKWDRTSGPLVIGRDYNFRLRYDSPFKSGITTALNGLCANGQCLKSSDGTDLGPDITALEAAQGLVKNARVYGITSVGATVAYLAPDAVACSVDYWTGSNTPTRVPDGGGPRVRNVPLTGLTSGTAYNYIVQCAVEQPSGSFVTRLPE